MWLKAILGTGTEAEAMKVLLMKMLVYDNTTASSQCMKYCAPLDLLAYVAGEPTRLDGLRVL